MAITLHSLTVTPGSRRSRRRVGRGESSGWGRTSGKGNKGQMARTGHKRKPAFEGGQMRLIRRIPKRGFTGPYLVGYIPVNVRDLNRFEDGATVTLELLKKAGLINGPGRGVKILGTGEVKKKLTVRANNFSAAARTKIEAAGGTCEVMK